MEIGGKILLLFVSAFVLWGLWVLPEHIEYWKFRKQEKKSLKEIDDLEEMYRK